MNLLSLFGQTSNDIYAVDTSNAITPGIMMGLIVFMVFILLATYVLVAIMLSRIFRKAGVEGWKAWIPVYNTWVTLELGEQKGWWALLLIAPLISWIPPFQNGDGITWIILLLAFIASIVGTVFLYIAMYKIGLKLGKEGYFVLWAIFLPLVWYVWLAFDKSTWSEPNRTISPADNPPTMPSM